MFRIFFSPLIYFCFALFCLHSFGAVDNRKSARNSIHPHTHTHTKHQTDNPPVLWQFVVISTIIPPKCLIHILPLRLCVLCAALQISSREAPVNAEMDEVETGEILAATVFQSPHTRIHFTVGSNPTNCKVIAVRVCVPADTADTLNTSLELKKVSFPFHLPRTTRFSSSNLANIFAGIADTNINYP